MDDEEYRLLARIERGETVFRPAGQSAEERDAFQHLVARLLELRERGWIRLPDGRVSQAGDGTYLVAGACDLTPEGAAALKRDRRLGPRPDT